MGESEKRSEGESGGPWTKLSIQPGEVISQGPPEFPVDRCGNPNCLCMRGLPEEVLRATLSQTLVFFKNHSKPLYFQA